MLLMFSVRKIAAKIVKKKHVLIAWLGENSEIRNEYFFSNARFVKSRKLGLTEHDDIQTSKKNL